MGKIFRALIQAKPDVSTFIIRVTLAIVIFPHGAQKLFGWFGGHGPSWTIEMWYKWWEMPAVITVLVILGESLGTIALAAGFLGRFMAASIGMIMIGAIYILHWNQGFFMNWYAQSNRGEGFEYHLLVLGMVLVILIKGSGKWSVDELLSRKLKEKH